MGGYVENYEMEDSDVGENKTEETDTEESDQVKVTTFVYDHPPTTSFYKFYTPPPVTRGLI